MRLRTQLQRTGSENSKSLGWWSKRTAVAIGSIALTGVTLSACSSTGSSSSTSASSASLSATNVVNEKMLIETGKMDGKPGWPRFVPANFSVPAGATVDLTIVNYDDGTAPLPTSSPWSKVMGADPTFGIIGGGVETINSQSVTQVDAASVSHTFEIPGLLLNVPIPAVPSGQTSVSIDYKFRIDKPGRYLWICAAPCGSGTTGNGGAMGATGWMRGYITVT